MTDLAELIAAHPRYERADGVVFCQHAHAFAHFDSDEEYAKHVADDVVLPYIMEQRRAAANAIHDFIMNEVPKLKGSDWTEEFTAAFEGGMLTAAALMVAPHRTVWIPTEEETELLRKATQSPTVIRSRSRRKS